MLGDVPDVDGLAVVEVATSSLRTGLSPRVAGCSEENVERLAELDEELPPILVLRSTNQVIDGMHRLLAARRRGRETIAARFCDSDEDKAFLLAVQSNAMHGLPLSLHDRKAAAARILRNHEEWSNRRIASIVGLSDKTVTSVRNRLTPVAGQIVTRRIGLDGRARPATAGAANQAPATSPPAGDTAYAPRRRANIAIANPVVGSLPKVELARGSTTAPEAVRVALPRSRDVDLERCLRAVLADPALRATDTGRILLRMLTTFTFIQRDFDVFVGGVPSHNLEALEILAQANADAWRRLADGFGRRKSTAGLPQSAWAA